MATRTLQIVESVRTIHIAAINNIKKPRPIMLFSMSSLPLRIMQIIDFATTCDMESLRPSFQGELVATGPIVKTTEQTMRAAVRPEEIAPSRGACTCELCRNNHTENQSVPASRQAAGL